MRMSESRLFPRTSLTLRALHLEAVAEEKIQLTPTFFNSYLGH
jgi:hypothetical protein